MPARQVRCGRRQARISLGPYRSRGLGWVSVSRRRSSRAKASACALRASADRSEDIRLRRTIQGSSCEAHRAKQDGGARRDRTDDLMLAKHALYQLSYGPFYARTGFEGQALWEHLCKRRSGDLSCEAPKARSRMVGPGRFELPTSRLSGVRSNQLSYGPADTSGPPVAWQARTSPWSSRSYRGLELPTEAASDKGKEKRRRRRPAPV
jgi:hypothetical protein